MEDIRKKVNLVLGASGYGKSWIIYNNIIRDSLKNPEKNYVVVVPEQFTMSAQKEIVAKHPNHGVMNVDIVSFNRLSFRVFEELGINNLSVLDDTGKSLILKKVIEENKKQLGIYKNKVNMTGFVEEMKSAISELYSYGISLDEFESIKELTKYKPYISEKLKDIFIIYKKFKETLGEKYITKEEILEKLCQVCGKSSFVKNSQFIFDGFTGFTPVQYKVLGLLMEYSEKVTIAITISEEETKKLTNVGFSEVREQELFLLSKSTINKIFSIASDKNISIRKENITILSDDNNYRHRNNEELRFLEKNLFRNTNKKFANQGKVKVFAMDNPLKEVDFAAAFINNAVRNEGYRYRDFAVITGDMDTYRQIISQAFDENEIPYFMDNKRKLILNPCVVAIRSALDIIREDFSYESVFRFLKCGISNIDRNDIDILENYVLEYGIRGFKRYSKSFVRKKNKSNEKVNEIREKFVELISDFRNSIKKKDLTVRDLTIAVYEFIEKLNVFEKLKAYEEKFSEEGKLSLSKEYKQTYGLIIELLDKIVELMGDTKINVRDYGNLLDAGFEEIKVGVIPLNIDNVVVGDIERTRLGDIKVLFVLGVNDGIIPKTGGSTGLLSQSDRGYLKKLNVELSPTNRENIFIQRFYLYLNLTKPNENLILTYSLSNNDGNSLRPSYLVGVIAGMYNDTDLLTKNLLKDNISTREMGLKYVAGHFVNNEDTLSELTKELFTYFYSDNDLKEKLFKIVEGAYFSSNTGKIDEVVANALYGDDVIKSASRLEKYAACAYAHFLSYGLQLAQRKVYEINAADIGNIYHKVIELFSKEMELSGLDFRTISENDKNKLLDNCIEKVSNLDSSEVFLSTKRNKYLLDRIKDVSSRTIWAISEHIKAGNFNPKEFELSFSDGRIDRVDTYEEDDRMYVKIIDYKSGSKKFDIEEVMNGLQIQLVYYMGAVLDIEKEKHKDKVVMPGGAFYFNIKSPYIDRINDSNEVTEEEKFKERMLAEYKMSGLVNSDRESAINMDASLNNGAKTSMIIPLKLNEIDLSIGNSSMGSDNFTKIIEYVRNKTDNMCDEVLSGNIKVNPYKKGNVTPCEYCQFKGLCTFNEKYSGNKFRTLNKYEPKDIYNELGGNSNVNEMD